MEIGNIVLDTNAVSNLFRGDRSIGEMMAKSSLIYIPSFVIAELLIGFKGVNRLKEHLEILKHLENQPKVRKQNPGNKTIEIYADIFYNLKQKGNPIPLHDVWIAAITMELDATIVTYNNHFKSIEELKI